MLPAMTLADKIHWITTHRLRIFHICLHISLQKNESAIRVRVKHVLDVVRSRVTCVVTGAHTLRRLESRTRGRPTANAFVLETTRQTPRLPFLLLFCHHLPGHSDHPDKTTGTSVDMEDSMEIVSQEYCLPVLNIFVVRTSEALLSEVELMFLEAFMCIIGRAAPLKA